MRKDEGPKEGWWETQRPAACREPLPAPRLNDRGRNHVTWAHWELESGKRGSPEGTIVWLKHGGNEEEYSSCSHVSHVPAGVTALVEGKWQSGGEQAWEVWREGFSFLVPRARQQWLREGDRGPETSQHKDQMRKCVQCTLHRTWHILSTQAAAAVVTVTMCQVRVLSGHTWCLRSPLWARALRVWHMATRPCLSVMLSGLLSLTLFLLIPGP